MSRLRVAIVGCGAVARAHLPVLDALDTAETTALVDKVRSRATDLAAEFDVAAALDDYRELPGLADAAIVALPHHLHAPVTTALLEAGLHVFVEKPMAMTVAECEQMVAAADAADRVLAVGMARRFYASAQWIKNAIDHGLLGDIRSFSFEEGFVYDWPVASDFMFRKEAGGGVLADTGAHTLDTLLWWLGDWEDVDYRDDAEGGVEADCRLDLRMKSGATGTVELSRTRNLRNRYIIRGTAGELRVDANFYPSFELRPTGADSVLRGNVRRDGATDAEAGNPLDCFERQMVDFVGAARGEHPSAVPGREGLRAVALIERCHASRQPLDLPW